jgi:hypothetical protein
LVGGCLVSSDAAEGEAEDQREHYWEEYDHERADGSLISLFRSFLTSAETLWKFILDFLPDLSSGQFDEDFFEVFCLELVH